jgi:hypothetical protein
MYILTKIASWFRKAPQRSTQDQIHFDLELHQVKFCNKCGEPFVRITEQQNYCSKICRLRFNNAAYKLRHKKNG